MNNYVHAGIHISVSAAYIIVIIITIGNFVQRYDSNR